MYELIVLALAGAVGGLIRHVWSHQGRIVLPKLEGNMLDIGFLLNVFLGAVCGLFVPYGIVSLMQQLIPEMPTVSNTWVTALFAGYFSAHFFEKIAEFIAIGSIGHKLALILPTDTRKAVVDLEKAIAEQKERKIPTPTVFSVEGPSGRGYSPEEHLEEMKKGTPLGKSIIEGRRRFYAAKFPAPEVLAAALERRAVTYPFVAQVKQILIVVGGGWDDLVTDHSAYFRNRDVVEYAKTLGWSTDPSALRRMVILAGQDAKRTLFENALGATSPTVWVNGTGHGNAEILICGWMQDKLMDLANAELARGLVMTIVSCSGGASVAKRMGFDEVAEKSYTGTVYICVDDQSNHIPENDKSSTQFSRCFLSIDRAVLEDRTFKEVAMVQVATYDKEMNDPATPPVNKYYLQIDFGVLQHVVKRDENWSWQLLGGTGPQPSKIDKVEFLVNDEKIGEETAPKTGNIFEHKHVLAKGLHKFRAIAYSGTLPPQPSETVEFEVTEPGTVIICRVTAPKQGDKLPAGSISLQVEAQVETQQWYDRQRTHLRGPSLSEVGLPMNLKQIFVWSILLISSIYALSYLAVYAFCTKWILFSYQTTYLTTITFESIAVATKCAWYTYTKTFWPLTTTTVFTPEGELTTLLFWIILLPLVFSGLWIWELRRAKR